MGARGWPMRVRGSMVCESSPRPHREGSGSSDSGSASILAVGVIGGLAALLMAALTLAAVLIAGQQARTAADLSALAGAGQVVIGAGRDRVCAEADGVAASNGARLESCELGMHPGQPWPRVLVSVRRDVVGTPWSLTARAAAGAATPALEPVPAGRSPDDSRAPAPAQRSESRLPAAGPPVPRVSSRPGRGRIGCCPLPVPVGADPDSPVPAPGADCVRDEVPPRCPPVARSVLVTLLRRSGSVPRAARSPSRSARRPDSLAWRRSSRTSLARRVEDLAPTPISHRPEVPTARVIPPARKNQSGVSSTLRTP
ncbi:hypothetical protein FY030_01625 [Ornithinimicrobium pratense]|uniref:Flp pilus-assembly TadE/G-like family protein n=1 Tax=Ornithinimicrobium pratense TaxID=2593973 RepID=A0A5J6V1F9_9MICO|nr:hypothetical protein FY030_01625 [Ornithinimicrobium pratense]